MRTFWAIFRSTMVNREITLSTKASESRAGGVYSKVLTNSSNSTSRAEVPGLQDLSRFQIRLISYPILAPAPISPDHCFLDCSPSDRLPTLSFGLPNME